MKPELRKTGISAVGDMPWGTHFCHFYETKQDLLDTLVPYFKAGLESKEFCVWVVSDSDLLSVEAAKAALAQAVPDLDRHLSDGNIEILGLGWYLDENVFNLERVTSAWDAKLEKALALGYAGMRVSGDTLWLAEKDWKDFCAYEKQLNDSLTDRHIKVLCTYPLRKAGAAEVLDVVQVHQFAIARRRGEWAVIQTPGLIPAQAEIRRLNEQLEQRVIERTDELVAANEALKNEITERRRIEEELRERAADLTEAQRVANIGNWIFDLRTNKVNWSEQLYRIFGIEARDFDGRYESFVSRIHPDDRPRVLRTSAQAKIGALPFDIEYRIIAPNDEVRIIREVGYAAQDEAGNVIRLFGTAQDITDRKQAEDVLRRSEDHLRLVLDTTPALIHTGRPDGYLDYFNQRWLKYVGRSLEELQGWDWTASIHPGDVEGIVKEWRASLASGEPFQYEARVRQADGGYRWMLHSKVPLRDEHGNIVKWHGSSIDIEDRKQTEDALDERLRFETLLTELSAAFANLSTNEAGREIDKWLQTLVEFLGVDRATFFQLGEDWKTLYLIHSYTVPGIEPLSLPPLGLNEQFPWITDQLRQGNTIKWSRIPDDLPEQAAKEKEYAAKTGAKSVLNIPVLVGGSVICTISFTSIRNYCDWPDDLVARLRLVGEIFATAVERKRAEDDLTKEKEILEKIFDNIPMMIGFVGDDGRVKLVNPEWERTIGWTQKELEEQDVDIFAEAYPDPAYRQEVLDFLTAATGESVDLKIRVRTGQVIDAACAVVHLSDGTRVAIAQDITERKRAEEHIRATSEQLRALSAKLQSAKEEEDIRIAREIHDEMGSTLTSLRWDLERFDKDVSEAGEWSQLQELRPKIAEMMRLTDITIGTMRRIASELRPSILDDLGLMEAIEWQAQQFQTRTGIACRCDCSLENIEFDPDQSTAIFRIFQEALTNILSHAEATRVEVVLNSDGEFVMTISDNGKGITEDEKSSGLSLGILGMRERAHLIGGKLEISGTNGRGTVLTVKIPISDKANR